MEYIKYVIRISNCFDCFYVTQHAVGAMGGGQQLASPGSCLEAFRANPYIECNNRGLCHFYANKYSYWLFTITGPGDFNPQIQEATIKAGKLEQNVGRCRVCILDRS